MGMFNASSYETFRHELTEDNRQGKRLEKLLDEDPSCFDGVENIDGKIEVDIVRNRYACVGTDELEGLYRSAGYDDYNDAWAAGEQFIETLRAYLDTDRNLLSATYSPSRKEILQWERAALLAGNIEQTNQIIKAGVKLRDLYRESVQDAEAILPLDYYHSDVRLTQGAYLNMQEDIATSEFCEVSPRNTFTPEEEATIVSLISKLDVVISGEQASIAGVKERESPGSQKSDRSDIEL